MITNQCALARGAAPCFLFFFLEAIKRRKPRSLEQQVDGSCARRPNRRPCKENATDLGTETRNTVTRIQVQKRTSAHIFTRTHKELECSSLQHQWQAVDSNLFQMLITPLHWHVASLGTTTESMHEYIPVSYIHPRTRFGKEISWRRRYYRSPHHHPPPPSSGTWHGQRLAVESYWQQSRWLKKTHQDDFADLTRTRWDAGPLSRRIWKYGYAGADALEVPSWSALHGRQRRVCSSSLGSWWGDESRPAVWPLRSRSRPPRWIWNGVKKHWQKYIK